MRATLRVRVALCLAAFGLMFAGLFVWQRGHSRPPVRAVLRLSVHPADQTDLVLTKANSARFKYVVGKLASTRPYPAQQLELRRLEGPGRLEARIGLDSPEEARRYLELFVAALQEFCGPEVRIAKEEKASP